MIPMVATRSTSTDTARRRDRHLADLTATTSTAVVDAVLAWVGPRLRDLPWRATRDPWAVLVSEVMLQQTQVDRVIDRWTSFIERYPTPGACAAAPLADVLRDWQGLGFPRRARNLHATASRVAELGRFPDQLDELLDLPGVGPYTARAVLAFAFEIDAAVVDTNIARTLARLVGRSLTAREVQALADQLAPPGQSWLWNQALMDVGALHCRPVPLCDGCPLEPHCAWHGSVERPDPAPTTAKVSQPQPRFDGSDRQARGRLLKALGAGPVAIDAVSTVMGRSADVAARLVTDLVDDGLCTLSGDTVVLGDGR